MLILYVMHLTQQHPDLSPQNTAKHATGICQALVSGADPPSPAWGVQVLLKPSVPSGVGEDACRAGSQPIKKPPVQVPHSLTAAGG